MMTSAYLTKIELDYESAFEAGLRDTYSWHQGIWKAFPGRNEQPRNFLTRLDEVDGGLRLLLLSQDKPVRPDWCPEPGWQSKLVDAAFWSHTRYHFSLVANPTRKVRSDQHGKLLKNSRRLPLTKREELLAWLQRKGEQHGFQFDSETIKTIPRPRQLFIKNGKAGLHTATEFKGNLTVSDQDEFVKASLYGIGPAKAFGFGMLCLSPLDNLKSQI